METIIVKIKKEISFPVYAKGKYLGTFGIYKYERLDRVSWTSIDQTYKQDWFDKLFNLAPHRFAFSECCSNKEINKMLIQEHFDKGEIISEKEYCQLYDIYVDDLQKSVKKIQDKLDYEKNY